jgi:hypothetical protein
MGHPHAMMVTMRYVLVLLLAACANKPVEDRVITLTKGDRIKISTNVEGKSVITVTIVAGKPDTGVYTSTSNALLEDARLAKNALPDRNSVVSVRVNESNEIVSFATAQMVDIRAD